MKRDAPWLAIAWLLSCFVVVAPLAGQTRDLPWEVSTDQGEVVLPDVFYAEASENEQIMPLTVEDRYQIDRLIYPTIGNPNLYDRSQTADSLLLVLRLEEDLYQHLEPRSVPYAPDPNLSQLTLTEPDDGNRLAFFLVNRHAGAGDLSGQATPLGEDRIDGRTIVAIQPTRLLLHRLRGVPERFRHRRTLRVVFDREALAEVPAALYDVRFEVRKDGALAASGAFEVQYNAVCVFDQGNDGRGEYAILNVTDTQISLGRQFKAKTHDKLRDFVRYVNSTNDPQVRSAQFITFNGDLHNGGAPNWVLSQDVASTYQNEAAAILKIVKQLRRPIFLTVGNHDGYVSMGHPPGFVKTTERASRRPTLENVVEDAEPKAWPDFTMGSYRDYVEATKNQPGGRHLDVFTGRAVRRVGQSWKSWREVPSRERNMILYDGFYQWRRTYGPLYFSWRFGRNHYVNLNTFELRQHRRSGWGMYTVNYGGGMSQVQLNWLNRLLGRIDRASGTAEQDVIVLAHHDPRGGHNGKDYPYYFRQIDYTGIGVSARNYVVGEILRPVLCKQVPAWAQSTDHALGCLHDGLQEWMRADPEFDCKDEDRIRSGPDSGRCNLELFKPDASNRMRKHPYYSGYALIDQLAKRQRVRTLLLGHTHYNSLEILQQGDTIVPGTVVLDADSRKRYSSIEVTNPMRGFSRVFSTLTGGETGERVYDPRVLEENGIVEDNKVFVLRLEQAGHGFERTVKGAGRELAILRLTTAADLSSQTHKTFEAHGFAVFKLTKKERHPSPQINHVSYYLGGQAEGGFVKITELDLDRSQRDEVGGEPLSAFFKMKNE